MKKFIKIEPFDNGAHDNLTTILELEQNEEWAIIPDDMETPNFPFGEIEYKNEEIIEKVIENGEEVEKVVGTRKVVTKWIPGTMPKIEEVEQPVSEAEQLRADIEFLALMTGVEL